MVKYSLQRRRRLLFYPLFNFDTGFVWREFVN
jgi:hypothetical protein